MEKKGSFNMLMNDDVGIAIVWPLGVNSSGLTFCEGTERIWEVRCFPKLGTGCNRLILYGLHVSV